MLQLIIWILCVYLVLKAVELYLIAASSAKERNTGNVNLALVAGIFAVLAAAFFFVESGRQAAQVPQAPPIPYSPNF